MTIHLLIFALVLSILAVNTGFCQKWETPTDRLIYAENGDEVKLTWKLDLPKGKAILYAYWRLADDKNVPIFTLITVNVAGGITAYKEDEVSSSTFGELTFKKLDKTKDKKILVGVEFSDGSSTLSDTLTIEYVDYAPFFLTPLSPPTATYIENADKSKNIEFIIVAKGKPKPTVIWKLNNEKILNTTKGFNVTNTDKQVNLDTEVTSILKVKQFLPEHIGTLQVITRYGTEGEPGPQSDTTVYIDVQYSPKNITLTSNITNKIIIDEGPIELECKSAANPNAVYTITDSAGTVHSGLEETVVRYINWHRYSRTARFVCIANNTLGHKYSEPLVIRIINGTYLKYTENYKDSKWWIYYAVAVAVASIVFLGGSITLCVIRSRMRSMNIKADVNRVKMRSVETQDDYQRNAMRHNGHNHVYDLNQRGAPDGHTKTTTGGGIANVGYNFYDEVN